MPEYTYLACDWQTHEPIDELPLAGITLPDPLNKGGVTNASMPISPDKDWQAQMDSTEPYRTVLFVERDGVFIWGGWCWQRNWSSENRRLQLAYGQYDTYFDQRRFDATFTYAALDQLVIARALINHAQDYVSVGVQHGNVGNLSGVLRDRTYKIEEQKMVGQLLQQLSAVENGFDYHFEIERDVNGLAVVKFYTYYPFRGMTPQTSPLVFEYPGAITKYNWPEGDGFATRTHEVGGQPGSGTGDPETAGFLMSVLTRTDLIDQGYPVIDQTFNRNDIIIQSTLDAHTAEDARLAASINGEPSIEVDPSKEPVYGSYVTGDYAKISITDERFPNGMEAWVRIVDRQLTTASPSTNEKVRLVLERAELP